MTAVRASLGGLPLARRCDKSFGELTRFAKEQYDINYKDNGSPLSSTL
jgi:hypothetical protein